jgi:hypothetical protein
MAGEPAGLQPVICPQCGKKLLQRNLKRHERRAHSGSATAAGAPPEVGTPEPGSDTGPGVPFHPEEKSPATAGNGKKTWRIWERRPTEKVTRRRENTAKVWELLWGNAGLLMITTGIDEPVGRVLQHQAPWVGDKVELMVKGTFVDTIVQPLARIENEGETLTAIFGVPALVFALERKPELAPALMPLLRAALIPFLREMVAGVERAMEEEREIMEGIEKVKHLLPPEIVAQAEAEGVSPLDLFILTFFAPPTTAEEAAV